MARDALGLDWTPDACPCQYGPTGRCGAGNHAACLHDVAGQFAAGVSMPEGWLQIRTKGGQLVIMAQQIEINPGAHLYRCPCSCHSDPNSAGRLF